MLVNIYDVVVGRSHSSADFDGFFDFLCVLRPCRLSFFFLFSLSFITINCLYFSEENEFSHVWFHYEKKKIKYNQNTSKFYIFLNL